MARKPWDVGNLFAIPLTDGSFALGQVVSHDPGILNGITCVFFGRRIPELSPGAVDAPPLPPEAIAVQFVTKDLLTRRTWRVLGNYPLTLPASILPHEDTRASGWVGARVIGSGVIQHFLNAYFGLESWTQMKEPTYFDGLLLRPDLKPRHLDGSL